MSKAIYDKLNSEFGAESDPIDTERKRASAAIAQAIVEYLSANADVRITTTDDGLQTGSTAGNPTTAPATDVVLSGAIE